MSLKKQAFSGMIWTFVEMFGGQIINFFVNIILARKLFPSDYGLIGMIFVFITISTVLMDSGISVSILRSKDVSEDDYSTLFISNVSISIIIYAVIFLIAPYISAFYNKEILSSLIRIYGLNIIIQSFVVVQSIYLVKNLKFKKQTLMKLPAIIISSTIAIYMAYHGYGVWSLVWMYLLQNFFWALFHWIFGNWNPKLNFNYVIFKRHFSYGNKLVLVELLNSSTANIYQIILGKYFISSLVGNYTQAITLRQIPISNIYGAIMKVLFPIFSKIQGNRKSFKHYFLFCQEVFLLILVPILIFMGIHSKEILVLLFSEKWENADFFLSAACLAGIFASISNYNINILKIVIGSSKILRFEILNKVQLFFFIALFLIIKRDANWLIYTLPLCAMITFLFSSFMIRNALEINLSKMIFKTLIYIIFALLGSLLGNFLFDLLLHSRSGILYKLIFCAAIEIATFFLLIRVFRKDMFFEFLTLIKSNLRNSKSQHEFKLEE